ncbi:MAG: PilT/PilU family type 4a pilus ATPase [Lentisphaerae bacterium]|nr:PilT/PilU family type 4a pilus ATPase [Lentisphaerota bacterium]
MKNRNNISAEQYLNELYSLSEKIGASDIHLTTGEVPYLRTEGILTPVDGAEVIKPGTCDAVAISLALNTIAPGVENPAEEVLKRLFSSGAIDGATTSPNGYRYRFNVYRENNSTAVAMRRLDDKFLSLSELGLPARLEAFCGYPDGLVIVTGPTGSGKSTTLATLIDMINRNRNGHIITIEDPVEYIHKSDKCLVHQRQIGRDATSFNAALVESLRQDPDVILVGEIREIETIRTAITAAETGHLVFATLHASDCVGAIERFISVFPEGEQSSVRHQLSLVLRGVFAQHLLPSAKEGATRVVCGELLFTTTGIANLIATGRSQQIYSALETGRNAGMQTMEYDLARLLSFGLITEQTAHSMSRNPNLRSGWTFASGREPL